MGERDGDDEDEDHRRHQEITTVFNKLPFKETPSNNPQLFAFHFVFSLSVQSSQPINSQCGSSVQSKGEKSF